jgi:hypothetical protein
MGRDKARRNCKIDRVEKTSETLTGRAGLAPFVAYLCSCNVPGLLAEQFSGLRKSRKGIDLWEAFRQLLCFFMDGTNLALSHLDELAEDKGYAATIGTPGGQMLSSHQVKRLFGKFNVSLFAQFRSLLRRFFAWRLKLERPHVVLLNLDPMVMDNDGARKREGVQPTYKKVKGFLPLQVSWGPYLVDAILRGGSKNGNHGNTVQNTLSRLVRLIRRTLGKDVPIVVRLDAGFMDQAIFRCLEELDVGYIAGGKLYDDIRAHAACFPAQLWNSYSNGDVQWEVTSFGDRRGAWSRFRRLLFLRRIRGEDGQSYLPGMRPETVLYTNLGMGWEVDRMLREAGRGQWLCPRQIVRLYHGRGADELTWRAQKDFGTERLPFQRFYSNAAFYYVMLIALNAYEAFKRDVCEGIVPSEVYPTTFRRRVIDVAGKVVRHGGQLILKVGEAVWERLKVPLLWRRANAPPAVGLA